MIKTMKLQHHDIYPDGEWRKIGNVKDEDNVDDNDIYYYVDDDIDLNKLNAGDYIQLDEEFQILEVEE